MIIGDLMNLSSDSSSQPSKRRSSRCRPPDARKTLGSAIRRKLARSSRARRTSVLGDPAGDMPARTLASDSTGIETPHRRWCIRIQELFKQSGNQRDLLSCYHPTPRQIPEPEPAIMAAASGEPRLPIRGVPLASISVAECPVPVYLFRHVKNRRDRV